MFLIVSGIQLFKMIQKNGYKNNKLNSLFLFRSILSFPRLETWIEKACSGLVNLHSCFINDSLPFQPHYSFKSQLDCFLNILIGDSKFTIALLHRLNHISFLISYLSFQTNLFELFRNLFVLLDPHVHFLIHYFPLKLELFLLPLLQPDLLLDFFILFILGSLDC